MTVRILLIRIPNFMTVRLLVNIFIHFSIFAPWMDPITIRPMDGSCRDRLARILESELEEVDRGLERARLVLARRCRGRRLVPLLGTLRRRLALDVGRARLA